ncbi:hypothetical protein KJ695_04910 [Patescibacteria group bacterium]|nr:hypothetical protein [Patescibacteria group bacterium]MBU4057218.1 hypothetical protein [Patescibacteria group bacterium]MBU4368672.1 hypothetical protein [Patescibacteria group bacterium]
MKILNFFDKLEDNVRHTLSRAPNIYAFISGVGIVLFFRGVWMIADMSSYLYDRPYSGWFTLGISLIILLITGTLVSHHLQMDVLISGIKKEKRRDEKIASEIKTELNILQDIQKRLDDIEKELRTQREKTREDIVPPA